MLEFIGWFVAIMIVHKSFRDSNQVPRFGEAGHAPDWSRGSATTCTVETRSTRFLLLVVLYRNIAKFDAVCVLHFVILVI